jgi:hypothetical protein
VSEPLPRPAYHDAQGGGGILKLYRAIVPARLPLSRRRLTLRATHGHHSSICGSRPSRNDRIVVGGRKMVGRVAPPWGIEPTSEVDLDAKRNTMWKLLRPERRGNARTSPR